MHFHSSHIALYQRQNHSAAIAGKEHNEDTVRSKERESEGERVRKCKRERERERERE
jgi:hypothetical protein